jgi:hypothetical protein
MSKQDNFFTKVKIDDKDLKITAVNIFGNDLIVGDITGGLYNFRIKDKQKLTLVNKVTLKSKIEKILILSHINTAFVLSGGEVSTYILPNLGSKNALIKDKNIADIYINDDDKEYSNHLLTISKKKKIKDI